MPNAWIECPLNHLPKIPDSQIYPIYEQCNLKSKESFLSERYTYKDRIVCEIWTVSKVSRVRRLLSLYPIAGSENVFRYLDSPWGRVPDADFLRPATNHHQSSPSPTTSTHPQSHIKTKKNSLIPDRFTSTVSLTSSSSSFYIISCLILYRAIYHSRKYLMLVGSRFVFLIAL